MLTPHFDAFSSAFSVLKIIAHVDNITIMARQKKIKTNNKKRYAAKYIFVNFKLINKINCIKVMSDKTEAEVVKCILYTCIIVSISIYMHYSEM